MASLFSRLSARSRKESVGPDARSAASADDVAALYRLLLEREPESEAVVAEHILAGPSVLDVAHRLYHSGEAAQKRAFAVIAQMNQQRVSSTIEVDAAPEDLDQLLAHIRSVWSAYGKTEAYYSVLTDPQYLAERMSNEALEKFYSSGKDELRTLSAVFEGHGFDLDGISSVVELGCGVGRVGAALAARFSSYLGVDISMEHLALAQSRFNDLKLTNADFMHLIDFIEGDQRFDLFYSILVLQHNPPPIMNYLLNILFNRLNPGGFVYFQVPHFVYGYDFAVKDYLNGAGRKDEMEVHAFPERELSSLFAKHGIEVVAVVPDQCIGPLGLSNTYLGRKNVSMD